jgi:hypothetical protein
MSARERDRERDPLPEFDCEVDPETGAPDEACLREYLRRNLPLAV